MQITDLGTGNIVKFRNGFRAMCYTGVVESRAGLLILNAKLSISLSSFDYTPDMEFSGNPEYDIMRVETLNSPMDMQMEIQNVIGTKLKWERPQPRVLTREDIQKAFECEDFVIVEGE